MTTILVTSEELLDEYISLGIVSEDSFPLGFCRIPGSDDEGEYPFFRLEGHAMSVLQNGSHILIDYQMSFPLSL